MENPALESPALNPILAACRFRTAEGQPLSATAISMYWMLRTLGESGVSPSPADFMDFLGVARNSVWRAQSALEEAALVKFDEGAFKILPISVNALRKAVVSTAAPAEKKTKSKPKPEAPVVTSTDAGTAGSVEAPKVYLQPQGSTAAAPTAKKRAKKESTTPKLTDESKEWFLESPERMELYLRFGAAASGKTITECEGILPPAQVDWLKYKPMPRSENDVLYPHTAEWGINELMGFYWNGVCKYRGKAKLELMFPNWGRLAGEMKKAIATSTIHSIYARIFTLCNHFDLIKWRIGRIADDLAFDETTINHKLVVNQVTLISGNDHAWLVDQYNQMAQGASQPQD